MRTELSGAQDTTTAVTVGNGVLNWPSAERRSDRYGLVGLMTSVEADGWMSLHVPPELVGEQVLVYVVVTEARESSHIGDIFRGIFPSRPDVGERIVLGQGTLFLEDDCLGVKPDDGREDDWMDPNALYRANQQTVQLSVERIP